MDLDPKSENETESVQTQLFFKKILEGLWEAA